MTTTHDVLVIGAGLAGLTAARALSDGGREVVVLDKGRRIGGRLAHRARGAYGFDHGSPWVEPDGGAFERLVGHVREAGAALALACAPARIVGRSGMIDLVTPLAEGLDVRQGIEVTSARRSGDQWRVETGAGTVSARRLVSTVPVPQARRLFPELAGEMEQVTMLPCWTLMAAFDAPLGAPAPEWPDNGARVIREADKPGRAGQPEAWTMHAPHDWSESNLERDREEIVPDLLRMLSRAIGRRLPDPVHARAHRWRYARTGRALGRPFVAGGGVHLGGDWCLGPSAADAHASGCAIAEDIAG